MNVQEAAERLGISPITVRSHIQNGNLKARKAHRGYEIAEEDLEAFQRQRRQGTEGSRQRSPAEGFCTISEVAKRLSVSPRTVRYHIEQGRIQGEYRDGVYLIKTDSVEEYIRQYRPDLEYPDTYIPDWEPLHRLYYTVKEAADKTGLSKKEIIELVELGALRFHRTPQDGELLPPYMGRYGPCFFCTDVNQIADFVKRYKKRWFSIYQKNKTRKGGQLPYPR